MQHNKFLNPLDNSVVQFDYALFNKINHDWTNSFFDFLMPLVRESIVWVPLYLFLLLFGYLNFGNKAIYWMLAAAVTVIFSNFISSDVVKELVDRPRPCRDSMLEPGARLLLNRCPISNSFTSSHATNHFTLAMFIFQTLRHVVKWAKWFFVWAFIIIYAQVYVGVHFPIDVIGGALLGCGIGFICSNLYIYRFGLLEPKAPI